MVNCFTIILFSAWTVCDQRPSSNLPGLLQFVSIDTVSGADMLLGSWRLQLNKINHNIPRPPCDGNACILSVSSVSITVTCNGILSSTAIWTKLRSLFIVSVSNLRKHQLYNKRVNELNWWALYEQYHITHLLWQEQKNHEVGEIKCQLRISGCLCWWCLDLAKEQLLSLHTGHGSEQIESAIPAAMCHSDAPVNS